MPPIYHRCSWRRAATATHARLHEAKVRGSGQAVREEGEEEATEKIQKTFHKAEWEEKHVWMNRISWQYLWLVCYLIAAEAICRKRKVVVQGQMP